MSSSNLKVIAANISVIVSAFSGILFNFFYYNYSSNYITEPYRKYYGSVTDALSTMLRQLGEESEAASWLIEARSIMEPVELYNEE